MTEPAQHLPNSAPPPLPPVSTTPEPPAQTSPADARLVAALDFWNSQIQSGELSRERVKDICDRIDALDPNFKSVPSRLLAAEAVLKDSKQPRNDLVFLFNYCERHELTVSPELLSAFYAAGNKYICDAAAILPERRGALTPIEVKRLELFERYAQMESPPDFEVQKQTIKEIASTPVEAWQPLLEINLKLLAANVDLKFYRALATYVRADIQTRPSLMSIVAIISDYEAPKIVDSVLLIRDLLRLDSNRLPEFVPLFRERKLDEIARVIYRHELNESRVVEKPLSLVRKAFETPEFPHSEVPSKEVLDRVFGLYVQIAAKESALEKVPQAQLCDRLETLADERPNGLAPLAARDAHRVEFLACARELFRRQYGIRPYNTQMIAVLMLTDDELLQKPGGEDRFKGIYEQVKTGEGKSLLIALTASYAAACGDTVDVITSNRYLARRDVLRFGAFYEQIGIRTNHFHYTPEMKHEPEHFPVLYTTNDSLIFAHLSASLDCRPFFRKPRFGMIIVDESDNLLLDLGNQGCRISTKTTSLFSEEVMQKMLAFSDTPDCAAVSANPAAVAKKFIADCPAAGKASEATVAVFLQNAIVSKTMRDKVDFVIQQTKRGREIKIVDKDNTGRIQERTQWGQGLHHFVAMRNNCVPPKLRSLSAQMRHPDFIRMHQRVLCISGTIGDRIDRREIQTTYNLRGFDVPPHHPSKRIDEPLIVFPTNAARDKYILDRVEKDTGIESKRAAVLITAAIEKSLHFKDALQNAGYPSQLLTDDVNQDINGKASDEDTLIAKAGMSRTRTIATGVAGRGADIVVDRECEAAGGVDVIGTDIPVNWRVEYQIRGRAGRQGKRGSSVIATSAQDDNLLSMLPDTVSGLVQSLTARPDFGPESKEVRQLIEFSRRALTLKMAVDRSVKHERNALAQNAQQYFFTRVAEFAAQLEAKYPDLKQPPGDEPLENPLIDEIKAVWATHFEQFDIDLSACEHASVVEAAQRNFDDSQPKNLPFLREAFHEVFGRSPESPPPSDQMALKLWWQCVVEEYAFTKNALASLEFRLSRVRRAETEALSSALRDQVDKVIGEYTQRYIGGKEAPPKPKRHSDNSRDTSKDIATPPKRRSLMEE